MSEPGYEWDDEGSSISHSIKRRQRLGDEALLEVNLLETALHLEDDELRTKKSHTPFTVSMSQDILQQIRKALSDLLRELIGSRYRNGAIYIESQSSYDAASILTTRIALQSEQLLLSKSTKAGGVIPIPQQTAYVAVQVLRHDSRQLFWFTVFQELDGDEGIMVTISSSTFLDEMLSPSSMKRPELTKKSKELWSYKYRHDKISSKTMLSPEAFYHDTFVSTTLLSMTAHESTNSMIYKIALSVGRMTRTVTLYRHRGWYDDYASETGLMPKALLSLMQLSYKSCQLGRNGLCPRLVFCDDMERTSSFIAQDFLVNELEQGRIIDTLSDFDQSPTQNLYSGESSSFYTAVSNSDSFDVGSETRLSEPSSTSAGGCGSSWRVFVPSGRIAEVSEESDMGIEDIRIRHTVRMLEDAMIAQSESFLMIHVNELITVLDIFYASVRNMPVKPAIEKADVPAWIESEVVKPVARNTSSPGLCTFTLQVEWYLQDFVLRELEDPNDIDSMIVMSGSNSHAFATTCAQYIEDHWGYEWIPMVRHVVQNYNNHSEPTRIRIPHDTLDCELLLHNDRNHSVVTVQTSNQDHLVKITQILAWMCAQFRAPEVGSFAYSEVDLELTKVGTKQERLSIACKPLHLLDDRDLLCWNDMIGAGNIVRGFPVPQRYDEIGLELPFALMLSLGGILYPMQYKGGLILKGYSTALLPTTSIGGDSVQWHFVRKERDEEYQPVRIEDLAEGNDQPILINRPDVLFQARAFVGLWPPNSKTYLGTCDSSYHDIEPSQAQKEGSSWCISPENQVTLGLSKIVTAQANFKLLRTQALHVRDNTLNLTFDDLLERSASHPIFLFDTSTRQGWLVPELRIVLHLAVTEQLKKGRLSQASLPNAGLISGDGEAARKTVHDFRDLETTVRRIFTLLMNRREETASRAGSKSLGLRTFSREIDLCGWEISKISSLGYGDSRRVIRISKKMAGEWPHMAISHPDVLVLFGSNLGEVIKPARPEGLCSLWKSLPTGRDFLMANAECLSWFRKQYQKQNGMIQLTESLHLARSSGGCECKQRADRNFLFDVLESGSNSVEHINPDGAAIFGRCKLGCQISAEDLIVHHSWDKDQTVDHSQDEHNGRYPDGFGEYLDRHVHQIRPALSRAEPSTSSDSTAEEHHSSVSTVRRSRLEQANEETSRDERRRAHVLTRRPAFMDLREQLQEYLTESREPDSPTSHY